MEAICYGRRIVCQCRIGGIAVIVAALIAAVLAVVCLTPSAARATTRSSVSVTGPATAKSGQQVKLHFRGYATSGVNQLRIWLDDRPCASTARAEASRAAASKLHHAAFTVRGHFRARLTVQRSSKGTHMVCAYLLHRGTEVTVARASWRYVTS